MLVSELLKQDQVVPVVAVENQAEALGLAKALIDGGVNVIEVTLRNEYGVTAINQIKQKHPEMVVLAGTVNSVESMQQVMEAGADGVVMPGLTEAMLQYAKQHNVPILPGVTSPSEILLAMQYGFNECKLFPAGVVGGIKALKAFGGPFGNISFCPTGGVSGDNFQDYLALPNVMCVGGTWIAPSDLIKQQAWSEITELCKATLERL